MPKTYWQTSPNSILEDFFPIWLSKFYAIFTSPNQILLDWGLRLVVFGADCDNTGIEPYRKTSEYNINIRGFNTKKMYHKFFLIRNSVSLLLKSRLVSLFPHGSIGNDQTIFTCILQLFLCFCWFSVVYTRHIFLNTIKIRNLLLLTNVSNGIDQCLGFNYRGMSSFGWSHHLDMKLK